MRRPVASAKPKSSVVSVVDLKTGRQKFHILNRSIVTEEDRQTGETRHEIVDRFTSSSDMDNIWELAKKRYRKAVRDFRETIDNILKEAYTDIPVYRDCDISDIMAVIRCQMGDDLKTLAHSIHSFIEERKNS
jgi:hypothetical protein